MAESYDPGMKGALAWWYQDTQRQRWPRLSLMAIDILSILAMSDGFDNSTETRYLGFQTCSEQDAVKLFGDRDNNIYLRLAHAGMVSFILPGFENPHRRYFMHHPEKSDEYQPYGTDYHLVFEFAFCCTWGNNGSYCDVECYLVI